MGFFGAEIIGLIGGPVRPAADARADRNAGAAAQQFLRDGEPDAAVPVPDQFVTSVCFGGADMRDLYIVTGGSTAEALGAAGGGCIFRTRAPVAGVSTPLARVRPAS